MRVSPNARAVLERRYLRRDTEGALVETPDEMLARVARHVAAAEARHSSTPAAAVEEWAARFLEAMRRLELLPNSPTLMNAGRELGQLSACFVLPVGDSLGEIFDAVKWAATIQQTGGGTGFAFSRLRPAGDLVKSTQGVASGPVSFIEVFNAATDAIRQGGVRRGANMGILRVDHPDVLEFITAKSDPARLRNFNVSVGVTEPFLRAVEAGTEYALVNPRTGAPVGSLEARRVWHLIAEAAWRSGEPGLVFLDRINADNPTPARGALEATNPCGELPLLPFESCNLASIDVGKLVRPAGSDARTGAPSFDWEALRSLVQLGVRFLDDVIDVNRYPLPQIEEITRDNRKIGLGVMGFADALIARGMAYDSEEALAFADELAAFFAREAVAASEALARERGPFPGWARSRWAEAGLPPRRNATVTSIAPTGTISIIAGCSGGIEPLYAVAFARHVLDGARLVEVHPAFLARGRAEGWLTESLLEEVTRRGTVRGLAGVPAEVQRLFATAYDVAPEYHVRMQAAFQRHVENAVSKTINFPREATTGDVERAYALAWRLGCKGITVYRDGSRDAQVLSVGPRPAAPAAAATPSPAPPQPVEPGTPVEAACPECHARLPAARHGSCTVCPQCGASSCV